MNMNDLLRAGKWLLDTWRHSQTRTPHTAAANPASAGGYPPLPANLPSARVIQVIDGDTLDVVQGGRTLRLRLIGINSPEVDGPYHAEEYFGRQASERAKEILTDQTVLLETDSSQGERDQYDRLLCHLWLEDGRLFPLDMLREGYAFRYWTTHPHKYVTWFQQAEREARAAQRGAWKARSNKSDKRS